MKEIGIYCPGCGHCLLAPSSSVLGLTRRQRIVLNAIANLLVNGGASPTYQEVAFATGTTSKGNITQYIMHLRARGYLVKAPPGRKGRLALTLSGWALFGRDAQGKVAHAA